jgi:hypothetical protein
MPARPQTNACSYIDGMVTRWPPSLKPSQPDLARDQVTGVVFR